MALCFNNHVVEVQNAKFCPECGSTIRADDLVPEHISRSYHFQQLVMTRLSTLENRVSQVAENTESTTHSPAQTLDLFGSSIDRAFAISDRHTKFTTYLFTTLMAIIAIGVAIFGWFGFASLKDANKRLEDKIVNIETEAKNRIQPRINQLLEVIETYEKKN